MLAGNERGKDKGYSRAVGASAGGIGRTELFTGRLDGVCQLFGVIFHHQLEQVVRRRAGYRRVGRASSRTASLAVKVKTVQ